MSYETQDKSSTGSLFGVAGIALLAMALLTFGYNANKDAIVADSSPAPARTTGAAINPPSQPTQSQPQNPAPDTRSSPTASDTGTGAASGGPAANPDNAAPKQ